MRGKRRTFRMDLMVVRLSKTGILNNAEPCFHCLMQLQRATFVNIKNVYYSVGPDKIVCKKFKDMVNSPTKFISSGYRNRMGLPRARITEQSETVRPRSPTPTCSSRSRSSSPIRKKYYNRFTYEQH